MNKAAIYLKHSIEQQTLIDVVDVITRPANFVRYLNLCVPRDPR